MPKRKSRGRKPTLARRGGGEARELLAQAFVSFTQAAGSLEKSYAQLQAEVTRLGGELEQANTELAASLQENARVRGFLARVLEGLPCGVLATSDDELQLTNPEAARLLEIEGAWKPGEATPAPVERLLGAARQAGEGRLWEYAIGDGAEAKTLAVTATSVAGAGEAAGGRILILRDVTDEKRMIEERETARRVQALAEIATLLAHEIRNPLGSLELFAGLIADSTASLPDVKKWVDHLQAGLRGLSATVNNVLQFHSQPSPQLMPTPLDRLLRETVEFLRPLARQRGMQASLINRVGTVQIAADPHRLRQVFFNLALNAFRAMSAGGALYFRLDWPRGEQGRRVLVEVEDNGGGIAAEHLEKVFDAGFTTHSGSPGLGLAVVRTVAEQHGAELAVRSAANRGTTFALRFPVFGEER